MNTLNVLMLMAAALSLDYSMAQDPFSGQVTELHTRKDLVKFLRDYIDADEAKVNQIKKWVNTLNILSEGSQDLVPPINAFKLMKKLNTDWGELESLLLESLLLQDMSHVTAHCHRENDGSNGMQSDGANALHQFAFMIKCESEGHSIFAVAKYINYGCYCGPGGGGTPVDALDRCCQVHDACYGKVQVDPICKTWYWQKAVPYIKPYHYTCDKESRKVTCLQKNDACEMVLCECDRVAAECFAKTPHHPENVGMDQSRCKRQ